MNIITALSTVSGDYIELPDGYTYLTAPIVIGPGQKLKGKGARVSFLVCPQTTDEAVTMSGAGGQLDGFTICRYNSSYLGYAVVVSGADCVIKDVRCDDLTATTGISITANGDRTVMRDVVGAVTDAGDAPTTGGIAAKIFSFVNAVAAGTNDLHALQDSTAITVITTGLTQPDLPRNVVVVKATSWDGGTVTVYGTDQFDRVVSENFPALTAGTETGAQCFKTLTGIQHSIALAGGNGYSIGSGSKLGVKAQLTSTTDYIASQIGAAVEAATLNLTYNTVQFTTALDGAKDFVVQANVRT